jgi:acyl-lipid omega-6 desaturase (Delta-12 desaturase)
VLPFLVWSGFMSFVVFLHHTHPAVRWYPSVAAWRSDHGALHGSVRVRFPWPFRPMVLGIMEHHAHHQAPGVPLYNLPRMQQALEKQTPLVTWQFSWRAYVRVCRRCKLYDYDAGRWVAFDRRAEELAIPEKTPVSVRGVVTRP